MIFDETTWVFLLSCLGFGFIPGPAMLQTVSLTLQSGRCAGLLASLGILLGGTIQVLAVALGAAALLHASPAAYQFLKFVGGLYLLSLGFQRLFLQANNGSSPQPTRNIIWTSALIEATNPKSALFYLSFLLPFVRPDTSLATGLQLFLLGVLANLLFSVADVVCVLIAHPLRRRIAPGGRGPSWARIAAGLLFILLGTMALAAD